MTRKIRVAATVGELTTVDCSKSGLNGSLDIIELLRASALRLLVLFMVYKGGGAQAATEMAQIF